MGDSYRVVPFEEKEFLGLLCTISGASQRVVRAKPQFKYFLDYLGELGCRTVGAELDYIDHDFLEDYASYYVKCFHGFKKECGRLHFFNREFGKEEFRHFVVEGGWSSRVQLQGRYLGFMVVKPLPECVFGRTCIVHYPADGGRRRYETSRGYEPNLFGMPLSVETLAFQEQDKVTAACATSALWSAFQATGRLFWHPVPTPVEITKIATEGFPLQSRILPNEGLTLEQMAHAIQGVGLEPYGVFHLNGVLFRKVVLSYTDFGIPPILLLELRKRESRRFVGRHAVCVTGYSLPKRRGIRGSRGQVGFVSQRIDEIYVHDDQVGPHAKMALEEDGNGFRLSTSWGVQGEEGIWGFPIAFLLPLYHKIRIPYSTIYKIIEEFAPGLHFVDSALNSAPDIRHEWDVRLQTVRDYKKRIREDGWPGCGEEVLFESLPRFLWQANIKRNGRPVLEILFDATDIESGNLVLRVDVFEKTIEEPLKAFVEDEERMRTSVGRSLGSVFWRVSRKGTCFGVKNFVAAGK